jgi:hypothetical protein
LCQAVLTGERGRAFKVLEKKMLALLLDVSVSGRVDRDRVAVRLRERVVTTAPPLMTVLPGASVNNALKGAVGADRRPRTW